MHRLWAELQSIYLTQLPPNLAAVPSSTLPLMTVDLVGLGLRAYRDSGKVWMGLGLGLLLLPDCIRSLTSTISNAKRQMRLEHVMQTPATRSTWRNEFHQWAGGRGNALFGCRTKYLPLTVQVLHTPYSRAAITIWISQAIDFYLITTTMKRSTRSPELVRVAQFGHFCCWQEAG